MRGARVSPLSWLLAALLLGAGGASHAARAQEAEPLAIVVNRTNPIDVISFGDLRRVFRGQRGRWSTGRRVTLVMRDPGAPERDALLHELYGLGEEDYRRGFLQAVFSGETSDAPKTLASTYGMLRFVFNVPGAIGYARASEVDSSVKVLRVDGRLPGEAGYQLEVDAR
jgi:hypothetical protein